MPTSGFDTKLVKDLAKILRDSDLSEIEVEHGGSKIRVAKQSNVVSHQAVVAAPQAHYSVPAPMSAPMSAPISMPSDPAEVPAVSNSTGKNFVTSPMVGTVYLSPEPGAKAFISVGDTVKEGQQIFIVEAMKTLNAVNAHCSGVIKEILVKDAQPVEFGEHLCVIE